MRRQIFYSTNMLNRYKIKKRQVLSSSWRIFYKDNKNTFLITDKTVTETDIYYNGHSTTSISEVANKLNPTWSGSWNTSYNGNKGALYLLQPSSWATYKADDAAYAVGGPSLDLYVKSWNATQGENITLSKDLSGGVSCSKSISSTKNKCNNIYYGGTTRTTGNVEDYWWLSSPAPGAGSSDVTTWFTYKGELMGASLYTDVYGVRPVVCIPTSVFDSKYK